jgi:hypothetical protein
MFLNCFIGVSLFSSPDKGGQGRQDLSAREPRLINVFYFHAVENVHEEHDSDTIVEIDRPIFYRQGQGNLTFLS